MLNELLLALKIDTATVRTGENYTGSVCDTVALNYLNSYHDYLAPLQSTTTENFSALEERTYHYADAAISIFGQARDLSTEESQKYYELLANRSTVLQKNIF